MTKAGRIDSTDWPYCFIFLFSQRWAEIKSEEAGGNARSQMLTPDLSKWVKEKSVGPSCNHCGEEMKGKGVFELREKGKSKKRKMYRGTDYY